jgi:hypothetical protein
MQHIPRKRKFMSHAALQVSKADRIVAKVDLPTSVRPALGA